MTAEQVLVAGAAVEAQAFIIQCVLLPQGYAALTAETSVEAIDQIRRSPPDLIVAPEPSGVDLANFVRQEGLDIPVILIASEWQPSACARPCAPA